MMLYRSLVLGLVGALVMLEVARSGAARPPGERAMARAAADEAAVAAAPTIIDVSRPAIDAGADVAPALGLRPGERVAAIDDAPVADASAALAAIRGAPAGRYLDLDVARAGRARRVLVLVH